MKVIKIDIKKEPMDVEHPTVYFAIFPKDKSLLKVNAGAYPEAPIDIKKERWQVERVCGPGTQERKYLVNVDDRGLFQDLMLISNTLIQKRIDKEVQKKLNNYVSIECFLDMKKLCYKDGQDSIRDLPWWKRLFNLR